MVNGKVKKIGIGVFCLAILAGALFLGIKRQEIGAENETEKEGETKELQEKKSQKKTVTGKGDIVWVPEEIDVKNILDSGNGTSQTVAYRDWNAEEEKDTEVQRLMDILDDNDTDGILEQAAFLVASDSDVRRHSVIPALTWVGTPQAAGLLLPLMEDENDAVADEANRAMEQFFDRMIAEITVDPKTGELVSDHDINEYFDTCVEAIKAAKLEESDILMVKVAATDVKLALPILLEILENGSAGKKEYAAKYIDLVTHADGVTNREEAMVWLQENELSLQSDETTENTPAQ